MGACFDQASPFSLKEAGASSSSAVADGIVARKGRNPHNLCLTDCLVCLSFAPLGRGPQSVASAPGIHRSRQPFQSRKTTVLQRSSTVREGLVEWREHPATGRSDVRPRQARRLPPSQVIRLGVRDRQRLVGDSQDRSVLVQGRLAVRASRALGGDRQDVCETAQAATGRPK